MQSLHTAEPVAPEPEPEPARVTITPYPDSAQWLWSEANKKEWREVTGEGEEYVAFCNHWYDSTARSNFGKKFPYELAFGVGLTISPTGTILVTEAYDKMYRRLLLLREADRVGPTVRGAVVIGQPGAGAPLTRSPPHMTTHRRIRSPGKTLFQKFMLAQLISAHEVVLLCDSDQILLFFRGKVYYRPIDSGFRFLPRPPATVYYPIWALVDVTDLKEPPIPESSTIWPVQTSSPNSVRWNAWRKRNRAALLGMPLWNLHDLMMGYVLACPPSSSPIPVMPFGGALSLIAFPFAASPFSAGTTFSKNNWRVGSIPNPPILSRMSGSALLWKPSRRRWRSCWGCGRRWIATGGAVASRQENPRYRPNFSRRMLRSWPW